MQTFRHFHIEIFLKGGRNPGEMGAGSLREVGEEGLGGGIPRGAEDATRKGRKQGMETGKISFRSPF